MDKEKTLKEIYKRQRVETFLKNAIYREATSARYKQHPHSYTLRANWNDKEFIEVVKYMRKNSVIGYFFKFKQKYFYLDGYKYWTMGYGLDQTKLINKAKLK